MPHHNGPDLAALVSVLKVLVKRLPRIVESDAERSQTIPEFCSSRAHFSQPFLRAAEAKPRAPDHAPR